MAKTKSDTTLNVNVNAPVLEPTSVYDPWNDKVTIKIPRDRNNKEDVQVIVNGRRFVIMRGIDVDIPRPVFDALRDQEEAQFARYNYIDENEIKISDNK